MLTSASFFHGFEHEKFDHFMEDLRNFGELIDLVIDLLAFLDLWLFRLDRGVMQDVLNFPVIYNNL
jgi:hypothetical protein